MSAVRDRLGLADWLRESALPFWAARGFDAGADRFRERLDRRGAPLDVPHRSMVQARQIFVYAEAARLGWRPDGAELAHRAMMALERDFTVRSGGRVAVRFASGGPHADVFDSYGHAFVLLATASLYALAPSRVLERLADGLGRWVEVVFTYPLPGVVFDAVPTASSAKRQNPAMHLFEALLALDEAMPGRGHLERAGGFAGLFAERLHDRRTGAVIEHFARDWTRHPDPALATLVEPGHLFEWMWLLDRFARRSGRDLEEPIAALAAAARAGVTDAGRVVDGLAAPDLVVTAPAHRLWPHTEAVKAAAVRHRAGVRTAAAEADGFALALGRDFLDRPFVGGWIDRIDEAGLPLTDEVPASSLYHLMLAGMETATAFGPAPTSELAAVSGGDE